MRTVTTPDFGGVPGGSSSIVFCLCLLHRSTARATQPRSDLDLHACVGSLFMSLTNPPSSAGGPLTTSSIRPTAASSVSQNPNLKRSVQAAFDGK